VNEVAVTPLPRKGRIWVILILGLALFGLGYALVNIATQKPGRALVDVEGIETMQETFAGVPQEGDRVGSADAPVAIQYFADMQCGGCRSTFLETIPPLVTDYARPGKVKILLRHYSVAENPTELGFYGAEAAAEQNYGWNYTYLFFRNQNEAKKFGIDNEFMASLAGGITELHYPEWQKDVDRELKSDGPVAKRLESYEDLGTGLGMRANIGAVISGPDGTKTLQDGPSLAEFETAIEAVGG
jgi:hypothetical protein